MTSTIYTSTPTYKNTNTCTVATKTKTVSIVTKQYSDQNMVTTWPGKIKTMGKKTVATITVVVMSTILILITLSSLNNWKRLLSIQALYKANYTSMATKAGCRLSSLSISTKQLTEQITFQIGNKLKQKVSLILQTLMTKEKNLS